MKNNYIIILLLLAILIINISSTTKSIDSSDNVPVGTVIYSIIEPNIFLRNFPNWKFLDGQEIKNNYLLKKYTNLDSFPDLRGNFIRSSNYNGIGKDPEIHRKVASNQLFSTAKPNKSYNLVLKDSGKHSHKLSMLAGINKNHLGFTMENDYPFKNWNTNLKGSIVSTVSLFGDRLLYKPGDGNIINWNMDRGYVAYKEIDGILASNEVLFKSNDPGGDTETRPVNVSLYSYIKVN